MLLPPRPPSAAAAAASIFSLSRRAADDVEKAAFAAPTVALSGTCAKLRACLTGPIDVFYELGASRRLLVSPKA